MMRTTTATTIPDFPQLVASVTEEEDEDESKQQALAYVLRYETMIRQQEAEDLATLEHIRPCLERLEELAGLVPSKNGHFWTRQVSFHSLKQALEALEAKREEDHKPELLSTDRQLMMVLKLLTQKADHGEEEQEVSITWAEFLQAYKTCIAGMLTLQHLPTTSIVRQRARDRSLALLSLFESPSTKIFGTTFDSSALTTEMDRPGAASHFPVVRKFMSLRQLRILGVLVAVFISFAGGLYVGTENNRRTTDAPSKVPKVETCAPSPTTTSAKEPTFAKPLPPSFTIATQSKIHSSLPTIVQKSTGKKLSPKNLPQVDATKPSQQPLIVGGALGLVTAPFAVSGMFVGGVTVSSLASAAVFCTGLISLAAAAVQGIFHLVQRHWPKA